MSLSKNNLSVPGRHLKKLCILVFALTCAIFPLTSQAQTAAVKNPVVFTDKDRETGLKYLEETKGEFIEQISSLSDAQLNFKTGPERWSIAEVAEHIIVAENTLYSLITEKILKAPAPESTDNFRVKDTAIWLAITNRETKFTAPEQVQPNGRWKSKAELLSNFETARAKTISYVKTTGEDLRNRFAENPVIGVIDGYQWFIFLNAHSSRHLAQIREIKAEPKFPKR